MKDKLLALLAIILGISLGLVLGLAFLSLISIPLYYLYNLIIVPITASPSLTYLQTLGIVIIISLLSHFFRSYKSS